MSSDEEPTPGVGPCLEDWEIVREEEARVLFGLLEPLEVNYVDLIVPHEVYEVFLRVFIGLDCLHLVEIRVRGCGDHVNDIKELYNNPEFTRIVLEGNCIEIGAPGDNRIRVLRALNHLGLKPPLEPVAYRLVKKLVLD
ncbi:MAG: hypothetical protein F7C35_04380 [Desulfurococcales archaeon]|nr:hypothetical protein [Desulfurococcales archaeon]